MVVQTAKLPEVWGTVTRVKATYTGLNLNVWSLKQDLLGSNPEHPICWVY